MQEGVNAMKEKIYKKTIIMFIMGILILMITTSAHALPCIEDWCFDTIPDSGDIAGPAGSTIGWGYTITNPDPVNWLSFVAVGADQQDLHDKRAMGFALWIMGGGGQHRRSTPFLVTA